MTAHWPSVNKYQVSIFSVVLPHGLVCAIPSATVDFCLRVDNVIVDEEDSASRVQFVPGARVWCLEQLPARTSHSFATSMPRPHNLQRKL